MKIRWKKLIPLTLGLIILVFAVLLLYIRHRLDASLPKTEGVIELVGPEAEIAIHRDERGQVRIEAGGLRDLAFGQGFVHAQERFFQMDLARRFAGGELAELFGERALEIDRAKRKLGCRGVARAMFAALSAGDRELFEAYAAGVGAGLARLDDVFHRH